MLTAIPVGLDEILDTFGDPGDPGFEAEHILLFSLPYPLMYNWQSVTQSRCHRLVVENFQAAFEAVRDAGFEDQVKHYGGIYAKRSIRGRTAFPSTHSWGIAIDLEPEKYPLGSAARFPDEIVAIFAQFGFFYGGDFKSRRDPMHFQLCRGY